MAVVKTITFKDYNDQEVTEDFYFSLTQADMIELEVSHPEGWMENFQKIISEGKTAEAIAAIKEFVLMTYGKKSEDGRGFIKNQKLREEFQATRAFSQLFVELLTEEDATLAFLKGVVPSYDPEILDKAIEEARKAAQPRVEPKKITRKELIELEGPAFEEATAKIGRGELVIVDEIA